MSKRIIFFLGHFIISIIIVLLVIGFIFSLWYPSPLGKATSITNILFILILTNIIIGPILSLLVYNKNKKNLKLDLSIIILLQVLAFSYGLYNIFIGRPVWIAYNTDRFELIRNNEIIIEDIKQVLPIYQTPSWFGPKFVNVEFAKDKKTRQDEMFTEIFAGISIAQRSERYVPFLYARENIQERSQPLITLKQLNDPVLVDNILKTYPEASAWVPLKASAVDMVVLLNKEKAEVIKIVDLRPWK